MHLPVWIRKNQKNRWGATSSAERRRRDELLIPLEVGRLEERRVLSHSAPTLTITTETLSAITQGGANGGTLVTTLISGATNTGKGIAVSATDNGGGGNNGTWQYNNNGTWTAIGTVSDSSALLLDDADSVRFVPNGGFTGAASITFRAWDESTGSDGTRADVSTNGGSTAFSGTTATASITVFAPAAPSFGDTGSGGTTKFLDDQTTNPFDNNETVLSVVEPDSADLMTVTVTLNLNGSPSDATGTLSGGGFTETAVGMYTLNGVDATDATSDLRALVFAPARGAANVKVTTTFDVSVTDSYAQQATAASVTTADVTGNVTPQLSGTYDFQWIPENSTSTTVDGTQVSAFLLHKTTDSNDNALGIAVTGVTDNVAADGQWEWSPDNTPASWSDIPNVSATSAFLLDNSDYLRFVPNGGFLGTPTISFVAWDGTVGTHHTTFDTTQFPGSGAFSSPSVTSSAPVAPLITIGGTGTTDALPTDTPLPFKFATISDSDSSDTVTITITQQLVSGGVVTGTDTGFTNGTLTSPAGNPAFTTDALGVYTLTNIPIGSAQAYLDALTFTPAAASPGTSVTTMFNVVVSDSFAPNNNASDDATTVVVTAPPVLNSVSNFTAIAANTASTPMEVSAGTSPLIEASPAGDGVAVTAIDDTYGTWQYSTDGTSGWTTITTASNRYFLLGPTDFVRFLSTSGGPTTATITLLAWNPSAGGTVDMLNSSSATTGAFSSAAHSLNSSITVYPVLSITGTGTTLSNDNQTSDPFNNGSTSATIADSYDLDTLTITITQQITTGPPGSTVVLGTDTSQANGVLTSSDAFSGFVDNGNGTYTLTVVGSNTTAAAAAATTELQNLVFTPNSGPPATTVDTTFQVQVADASAPVNTVTDSNTLLVVASVAPPMPTGTFNLPSIPEGASTNTDDPGMEVSGLPIGVGPSSGIAISVAQTANGSWQYSTAADPTNWITIPAADIGLSLPTPEVFLLAATDNIRFLPTAGANFTGTATITYQAWNQGSGTADHLANPTKRPLKHGLSSNTETASVTVYPVLTITGTHVSTSLDDQTTNPFSGATIGDTLSTENVTVTITQQQSNGVVLTPDTGLANGSLSGTGLTYNAGTGTYTLTGTASAVTTALQNLVFSPVLHEVADGQTVVTLFQIQVADTGFAGVKPTIDSGTKLTVTDTAPPVLSGAGTLPPIAENVSSGADSGISVTNLLKDKVTDADGNSIGIAVIGINSSSGGVSDGEWDYSTNGGLNWVAIPSVSSSSALLLAPSDLVRFLPAANFFGTTATIQYLAWDQTVGTAASMANPTANLINPTVLPGAGAFSIQSATSSIQVVAPASITVATPAQTTTDEAAINVFAAAFGAQPGITDPNTPAQTYTITVTQQLAGGAIDSKFANGSLAGGNFVNNDDGTYTLTGVSASAATAALEALVFTPKSHQAQPGKSTVTGFTITVSDGVNPLVLNSAVTVTATAVLDPPTFVTAQTSPVNLPVVAANGTVVGTDSATAVDFDSTITYAITAGNASGAYAINPSTGAIQVVNSAALTYSSSLTQLVVTATNSGATGVTPKSTNSTFSIALWEITASATAISADSSTTLTLTLSSAAPSATAPLTPLEFFVPVSVSWSDGAISAATLSLASPVATLSHFYTSNPNKSDPAAPIPITATFNAAGQTAQTQTTASVSGTGVGFAVIPETQSSIVELVAPPALEAAPILATVEQAVTEPVDLGVAQSQTTIGTDRRVVLRIISPLGDEGTDIQVPDRALNDLPGLFKKLPDGRYRVYLSESGHERLVIDVTVRQGRPVNSSEDSSGAGDRPPTSQADSDKADGLNVTEQSTPTSTPTGQAATTIQKQPANNSGQPATGGGNQNAPPSGQTPGATQTPPSANPSGGHGTPTAAAHRKSNVAVHNGQGVAVRGTPSLAAQPLGPAADRAAYAALTKRKEPASPQRSEELAALAAVATGVAAVAAGNVNPWRADEVMEKLSKRSLSKGSRLSRWLRDSANFE